MLLFWNHGLIARCYIPCVMVDVMRQLTSPCRDLQVLLVKIKMFERICVGTRSTALVLLDIRSRGKKYNPIKVSSSTEAERPCGCGPVFVWKLVLCQICNDITHWFERFYLQITNTRSGLGQFTLVTSSAASSAPTYCTVRWVCPHQQARFQSPLFP